MHENAKESIGRRVTRLRRLRGLSQAQLAQRAGISVSTVANIENDRVSNPHRLQQIAQVLDVDPMYLMHGVAAGSAPGEELVGVPMYAVPASCGHGVLVWDEQPFDVCTLPRRWLMDQLGHADARSLAVVIAEGDSMEPTFQAGDLLFVDLADRRVREGIWMLRIGDEVYAKRVAVPPGQQKLVLISDNPAYPRFEVQLDEQVEILGRIFFRLSAQRFG